MINPSLLLPMLLDRDSRTYNFAPPATPVWAQGVKWLGSVQMGNRVPLSVLSVTTNNTVTSPSAVPTARLYDSASSLVETVEMKCMSPTRLIFGKQHRLGSSYTAGPYFIVYGYTVSGTQYKQLAAFDVLPAGDVDGVPHSMRGARQPVGQYVVYESESGKLRAGRNPR